MASASQSTKELVDACARMKVALSHMQCAVLDLHEAFLERDLAQRTGLEKRTSETLERIRRRARSKT